MSCVSSCNGSNIFYLGFVWKFGGEGRALEKRKEQVEEIEDIEREGIEGAHFSS